MYIILEGEVRVVLRRGNERIKLATLGYGNFFGEMGVLIGDVRSADVEAISDIKVLRVTKTDIERLKRKNPAIAVEFLYAVCRELCQRLYNTDESVESYHFVNRALLNNQRFRNFVRKIWNKKEE